MTAGEAKNKLWSSHREPCWTERNSAKIFCWVKNNQENRSHALTGIRAAIHRTITGQPVSRSINILKDLEFTQANKMIEVVCKSYYKRGNAKPQHKNTIEAGDMEKLNTYFSNDCPDKLHNLCGSTFVIIWTGEEGKEVRRSRQRVSRTIKVVLSRKIKITLMWECMGYRVRRWIPSHRWNWCWVKL